MSPRPEQASADSPEPLVNVGTFPPIRQISAKDRPKIPDLSVLMYSGSSRFVPNREGLTGLLFPDQGEAIDTPQREGPFDGSRLAATVSAISVS